ncbi:MAG: hypothetical protein IJH18_04415 [Bacilli bacterium]|nr:hypothetical protein [Bacilli bacterium]
MEMTFFDKVALVIKYILSSFMTIEISILCLLLFIFIFLNIKTNDKKVKIATVFCFLIFIAVIIACYSNYVSASFKVLTKAVLHYIYFPSMAAYFFMMVLVTAVLIYSIVSKTMDKKIKVLNIVVACLEYLLFVLVISVCVTNNINLKADEMIYQNKNILALVQTSNVILFFYLEILVLYKLYNYFKKKFD